MLIKERIEKIKEYFKEMQIVTIDGEQIIYVIVSFPYGWVIDETIETKFEVTVQEGEYPTEFYFATNIDNGENKVFDAIEFNIEKMKDAIERAQLLKTKIAELKDIFQNENIKLDELRSLNFTWDKQAEIFDDNILIPQIINNTIVEKKEDAFPDNSTIEKTENETIEYNKKNKK